MEYLDWKRDFVSYYVVNVYKLLIVYVILIGWFFINIFYFLFNILDWLGIVLYDFLFCSVILILIIFIEVYLIYIIENFYKI